MVSFYKYLTFEGRAYGFPRKLNVEYDKERVIKDKFRVFGPSN